MAERKHINLDNIKELQLFTEEITVNDKDTGEIKTVKTVNSAEIVTIIAYMLGMDDTTLDQYYKHHYENLLEKLRADKKATIIRYLCRIRTALYRNFLVIDNRLVNDILNLDRMEYFDAKEINKLYMWGVYVIQPNYRSDKYSEHINALIDKNIDACKGLFPEQLVFDYIRDLFVIPNYTKKEALIEEYNKYKANRSLYPFQMYMHWEPEDHGNLLYSDHKFLEVLYKQHGEFFLDSHKFKDAADTTKQNIYDFIHDSNKVVMVVDCENSDAYKLYGVIRNLKEEDVSLIDRIILYDDYHTTNAWDYLEEFINIRVEHIEVERVTDAKSLVDIKMTAGVCEAYYKDGVDSFILCSSDSDFWGLISSIPEGRFLVMYEYEKCGNAIKEALTKRNIFHCAIDDFFKANAGDLEKKVLLKILDTHLQNIVGEDGWELTKQLYNEAYIRATEKEMQRFYEKYVRTLKLKVDSEGRFIVIRAEE